MSRKTQCHCVFASPTEQELATISVPEAGTALRVQVETGQDGYVRLEQLAHDKGLGWYVQKSFTIPAEALAALLPQLRKAECLMPRREESGRGAHLLFPVPSLRLAQSDEPERREA